MSYLVRPMSLLALPDRQILDIPLEAVTLFDFTGEAEFGELCFKKGQHVLVFCEDMSEGWTLAMLVDDIGAEIVLDPKDSRLTRGLLPQGFVEYISRPEHKPAELAESHSSQTNSHIDAAESALAGREPQERKETRRYASTADFLDVAARNEAKEPQPENDRDVTTDIKDHSIQSPVALEARTPETVIFEHTEESEDGPISSPDPAPELSSTLSAGEDAQSLDLLQSGLTQSDTPVPPNGTVPLIHDKGVVDSVNGARHSHSATSTVPVHMQPLPQRPPVKARQVSSSTYLRTRDPVERYILEGSPKANIDSSDKREAHDIEDGQWVVKIPPFHVAIPSYQNKPSSGQSKGEYTSFRIVSSIPTPRDTASDPDTADSSYKAEAIKTEYRQIFVERRYTHFQQLQTILRASLPLISIPDLPEKRLTGNFDKGFLDVRRRDLERYLRRISRHALIRSNRAFLEFLGCEDDALFQTSFPRALMQALTTEPYSFFARINHDSSHFDSTDLLEDARDQHERLSAYVGAVEKGGGIASVRTNVHGYREGMRGTGLALRELSHSLLRLISGLAQPTDPPVNAEDTDEPEDPVGRLRHRARLHHMQNTDGAFCFREDCEACLSTTKAIQGTSEALATVSNLYEANASTVLLPTEELLVEYGLPKQRYENLLSRHEAAVQHLETASEEEKADANASDTDLVSRCETVLSATMAEIEHAHTQRQQDLLAVATSLLDGQIAFHEHALEQLRSARDSYRDPLFQDLAAQGPRLPSLLEKAALAPPKSLEPLLRPSSFGLPPKASSLAYKPVNMLGEALTGAAGSLFGWRSASSAIRAQTKLEGSDATASSAKSSPNLAASRFVQFLDWTMNSRGEQRKHAT